jgi:acyl carrier protein
VSLHDPDPAVARDEPAQDAIAAEVFAVVADCLEIPAGDVRAEQALEADLGIDSLGIIQIGVALEHSLGFRAPNVEDALEVETVGDLVTLVRAQVAGR